jgi:hypothetical protein
MMKKGMKKGKWLLFGVLLFLAAAMGGGQVPGQAQAAEEWPVPTGADENLGDMVWTHLRTDVPEVQASGNYYMRLKAAQYTQGATGKEYTHAYFHIYPTPEGGLSAGLLATRNEVRWFVFAQGSDESQAQIECLRGTTAWEGGLTNQGDDEPEYISRFKGCLGNNLDIVGLNTWHGVRMVRANDGHWDISIEDKNRKPYLVARWQIPGEPSPQAIRGAQTNFMDAASEANLVGAFWQEIPYFKGADGKMRRWPGSDTSRSFAYGEDLNKAYVEAACPGKYILKDQVNALTGFPAAQWYTGKPFALEQGFECSQHPLF